MDIINLDHFVILMMQWIKQTILVMNTKSTNRNDLNEINIFDLYKKILKKMNYNARLEFFDAPDGSFEKSCPDLAKVRKLPNFKPLFNFDIALKKTIEWVQKNLKI